MKKISLSLFSILMLASFSFAQSLHVGAKAGANLTKIDGLSFNDGYQLGYQLGAFAEIDFGKNKNIGIQPEVLFNQTNSQFSSSFKDIYGNILLPAGGDDKVKLNYLSIPVLLRINASKLLTLQAGPQFSILIDDKQNLIENGTTAFKSGDLGAIVGAQINLGALKVYGRYVIGLSNINEIDQQDKWKNQQVQLGVGLRLL